ncbi:MAG: hypothetical protein HRT89_18405 [Lentisphaeria bacterium]|nr:hypothetical protein [Lentisphaeria bacterium]NQZ70031.1 hypothetical protein [Lentisphaeria bacterium]
MTRNAPVAGSTSGGGGYRFNIYTKVNKKGKGKKKNKDTNEDENGVELKLSPEAINLNQKDT